MADAAIYTYIAQNPFFENLSEPYLALISSHATSCSYGAQQRVFQQDAAADAFFIVRQGSVALEVPAVSGTPLNLQTVRDGQVLGWSWLIPPYRWLFDARAIEPSTLVVVDGKKMRAACDEDPQLGYDLLRRFAGLMSARLNTARLAAVRQYQGG